MPDKRIFKPFFLFLTLVFLLQIPYLSFARNQKGNRELTMEKATFGGGCFWCLEAIYRRVKGVEKVVSGYAGGHVPNPTYEQVCSDTTGHAEVVQITFNPQVISYEDLLNIFWQIHDPTQLNRQGNDIGTQYRSVIFYHNEEQHHAAVNSKRQLEKAGVFKAPIVTQIEPLQKFYPAEDYHQNYFQKNPDQTYCQLVINPKLQKFLKHFNKYLK